LPLFVWVAVIFGLSSVPDLPGGGVSLPEGTDKVVHLAEYAVFAFLLYRGLNYEGKRVRWSVTLIVIISGSALAVLDELYQSYIPGRDSSILDLAADAGGIVVGALAALMRDIRRVRKVGER